MSMMVSFVLSFFPRDVLDEILNLIESVSEDFPSYSFKTNMSTSNSKYKLIHFPPNILMLLHKDEIYKGALRNILSFGDFLLISVLRKFSNNLLGSRLSGMFYEVLQYSIPECSTKFHTIPLQTSSSTLENVPHYFFPSRVSNLYKGTKTNKGI